MHFLLLVPVSAGGIWLFFFLFLAEAAPAFVGTVALIVLVAFVGWILTALQLWAGVGAIFIAILAFVAFIFLLKVLSICWSRTLGHPSKEAHSAAIALADLKRSEARADRAALIAEAAHERAVRTKSLVARYRAGWTEDAALSHELIVAKKKQVWEMAEVQATQKVKAKADAEAVQQRQFEEARDTIKARAERAKRNR